MEFLNVKKLGEIYKICVLIYIISYDRINNEISYFYKGKSIKMKVETLEKLTCKDKNYR